MSDLNMKLIETLLKNGAVDCFFRTMFEEAINNLLQAELRVFAALLKREKLSARRCN